VTFVINFYELKEITNAKQNRLIVIIRWQNRKTLLPRQ